MRLLSKISIVTLAVMLLVACRQKNDDHFYDYLIQHPYKLRNQFTECQLLVSERDKVANRCSVVKRAANSIMIMLEKQQKNPESFGLQILQAQMALAAANAILEKQQAEYLRMRNSDISAQVLDAAAHEILSSEHKVKELKREVEARLAVVGLSSPE